MLQHIQPEGLFPSERLGFTQVVTAAPGRLVFVSGQTACDHKGRPVGGDDVVASLAEDGGEVPQSVCIVFDHQDPEV